jgi:hypothetical protein
MNKLQSGKLSLPVVSCSRAFGALTANPPRSGLDAN